MPLDEPLLIIETQPVVEGEAELLHDWLERAHPQELLLERANEPLRHSIAFRARTNAGLDVTPKNRSSVWKSSLIY